MSYIAPYLKEVQSLCTQHNVETMYIFGSAASSQYNVANDVDLLVRFKPGQLRKYFANYSSLKSALEQLFEKKVDLVEEQTLRNPYLIRSIEQSKKCIYG